MGQLITYRDALYNATKYFSGARYYDNTYRIEWPHPDWPDSCAIPSSVVTSDDLLYKLNNWIEDNISETIIYEFVRKSYRVVMKDVESWKKWDYSKELDNSYYVFYFRKSASALAFKLKFGEYIREITDKSPNDNYDYDNYEIYR